MNTVIKHAKPLSFMLAFSILFSIAHAEEALTEYEIKSGDSLWVLCQKFKQQPTTCWGTLAEINTLKNPNALTPQRTIKLPTSWLAEPSATASVIYVQGQVEYFAFNKTTGTLNIVPQLLTTSTVISQGDRIVTLDNSNTMLLFADQTEMSIKPNSDLTLDLLTHNKQKSLTKSRILLNKGRVTSLVNPNKKQSEFMIKTPFAVAAVRGTQFRVSVGEETSSSEVLEGLIDVQAEGQSIDLAQGFGSIVEKGKAPGQPIKLLDAPILSDIKNIHTMEAAKVKWKNLVGAEVYEIDLLKKIGNTYEIIKSQKTDKSVYHPRELLEGNYQVAVRGIDKNQLRGFNSQQSFTVIPYVKKERKCIYIQKKRYARNCF